MQETTITFIAQSPTPAQQQSPVPAPPLAANGIDWTAVLIPLLPAVFTGVVTGLIAPVLVPYAKWRFEKERLKHESRSKIINEWRSRLNDDALDVYDLLTHPDFPIIERMFTTKSLKTLEDLKKKYVSELKKPAKEIYGQDMPFGTYQLAEAIRGLPKEDYDLKKQKLRKVGSLLSFEVKALLRRELARIEAKWGLL